VAPLLPDLPRQHVFMGEAGLYLESLRLEPYVQVSRRRFLDGRAANETFDQVGLAYWIDGSSSTQSSVSAGHRGTTPRAARRSWRSSRCCSGSCHLLEGLPCAGGHTPGPWAEQVPEALPHL
jgi:hypothetical protein